jgi:serine protease Do
MKVNRVLSTVLAAALLPLGYGCDQISNGVSSPSSSSAPPARAAAQEGTQVAQAPQATQTQSAQPQEAPQSAQAPQSTQPLQGPAMSGPRQILPDFAQIVEANGKAVVNITATRTAQQARPPLGGGMDEDSPLYEFFRRFGIEPPQGPQGGMPRGPMQGQGSGFIVDANGIVLTNAHVLEGAQEVRVRLSDRREFKGNVVGVDSATDIAVVRIDAKNLPTVRLGDPSKLRVGEWVVAIGSPFGFENSVTAGIVSATSRSLPEGTYVPFIQTDAAVNPGNSGGPLFNMAGEVIGINSAIYSRTGGYMGVAFAIPIDVAANVKTQLVQHGRVERGRIGVSIQDVNQSLAQSFGLDRPRGALIAPVESGGPADKAGLKPGDVLLAIEGKEIERSNELPPLVASVKPGDKATFQVWRDRKKVPVTVTVGELKPDKVAAATGRPQQQAAVDSEKLGLALRQPNEAERRQLNGATGLVVERATGPAASAGIRPGDVVSAINGVPVRSIEDVRKTLERAGEHVALLIRRGDASLHVPVEVG